LVRFLGLTVLLIALSFSGRGQMPAAITIEPPTATAYDELTLIFDPALACFQSGSLAGLPSIAIHSGVTYLTGEIWQNVVNFNGTGYNGQPTTLLPTGDGRYSITYIPAEFYGLTGQTVTQICAVFNNGINWSQDGRDFIPNSSFCMDFFIPVSYQNTDPEFLFNLNMNKMIWDGNFDPLTDLVYVEIDQLGETLLTDEYQTGIYSALVSEGLIVGTVYLIKFRINANVYEDFARYIYALPGLITVDVWWNNIPLTGITFVVDMNYQAGLETFNPETDFVDIAGTMNGWTGSLPMYQTGPNVYATSYYFDQPGLVEYKFRINGDWMTSEFPNGGPNRMTWATMEDITLNHFYDDYNPDTWPATFEVDMNAEINSGNFNPVTDYLDIAGFMNGWDGHDVLFDRDWTAPGIYTIKMLIDKNNPYIEFKFRINGDWNTSEFPYAGPNRFWTVQDTTGGFVNLFQCVYNITDVPYPPYAYNLFISGDMVAGNEVTGNYLYFDPNADPEGLSLFQWAVSDDPLGQNAIPINGAVYQNYVINPEYVGKYLIFQVTPVSATGEPSMGNPVWVISYVTVISNTSAIETEKWQIYPNPARDFLHVNSPVIMESVEVYDLVGQLYYSLQNIGSKEITIQLSDCKPGIYFIKCINADGQIATSKFVKNQY